MALSIQRLEQLLLNENIDVLYYFVEDGYCCFVLAQSKQYGHRFWIYVQSKYEFKLKHDNERVFSIKMLDEENGASEETKQFESLDLPYNVSHFDTLTSMPTTEEELSNAYKPIDLNKSNSNNKILLPRLEKQMKRFSKALSHVRYKVAVYHPPFLSMVHYSNEVQSYQILTGGGLISNDSVLLGCVDLEALFSKIDKSANNLLIIKNKMMDMIEGNFKYNYSIMQKLLQLSQNMKVNVQGKFQNIHKFKQLSQRLENTLKKISVKKDQLNSQYNQEIRNSGDTVHLQTKMKDILKKEKELLKQNTLLENEYHKNTISTERILFDNTVLMERVIENLKRL